MHKVKPSFFIVGAPKCGTTSLYAYLRTNPSIYMPDEKEPMFFGKDHHVPGAPKSQAAYERLFSASQRNQIAGEASANYFYSTYAAEEIRAYQPQAKIIIMLRNPIRMMHSLHSQLVFMGVEPETDFTVALKLEDARRAGRERPPSAHPYQSLLYRHVANYVEHTGRFLQCFGQNNVHVMLLEEFKEAPDTYFRKTLQFLSAEEALPSSWAIENRNKEVRSKLFRDLSQSQFTKAVARTIIPRTLRHRLDALSRSLNASESERAEIPNDLLEKLTAEFSPKVAELESLLERDIQCWAFQC